MSLSALIKKGELAKIATVTPATIATQEDDKAITVADVATVTVAKGTELASALLPNEEADILAWLAHIDETESVIIAEVLDSCRTDMDARRYYLKRSEEVPEPVASNYDVTCRNCIHFERIDHPHLGHCAKGEPELHRGGGG